MVDDFALPYYMTADALKRLADSLVGKGGDVDKWIYNQLIDTTTAGVTLRKQALDNGEIAIEGQTFKFSKDEINAEPLLQSLPGWHPEKLPTGATRYTLTIGEKLFKGLNEAGAFQNVLNRKKVEAAGRRFDDPFECTEHYGHTVIREALDRQMALSYHDSLAEERDQIAARNKIIQKQKPKAKNFKVKS